MQYSEISPEHHLGQMVEPVLQQDKKKKLIEHCLDVCLKKIFCKYINRTMIKS